jgi:GTPase SAR1 family protein
LRRRAADIRQGLFSIVVIGKFKHGKSTLINALLGREVVRARAIPTTAIITMLVHGDRSDVAIYEAQRTEPRYVTWQHFVEHYSLSNDDIDSSRGNRFAEIDYAQIEAQHPLVAQGVKLVDSPGIGEEDSRLATTKRFMRQAQAAIFVLDANRLLGEEERAFIREQLGEGRLDHVFFVVNRINQIDQDEIDVLAERLKALLGRHFVDEYGRFDADFYSRRVFFVDARSALTSRNAPVIDQQVLERSGVPRLEAEIYNLLGSEARFRAVIGSSVQSLTGVLFEAQHQAALRKLAIRQPLGDLIQRREGVSAKLVDLRHQRNQIHQSILDAGDHLYLKASADLANFIARLDREWEQNSAKALPFASIGLADLAKCAYSEDAKQRVVNAVQNDVGAYIRLKLAEWSDSLQATLADDITMIEWRIQRDTRAFLRALSSLQDDFVGGALQFNLRSSAAGFELDQLAELSAGGSDQDLNDVIKGSLRALYLVLAVWIAGLFNPIVLAGVVVAALAGKSIANPFRVGENFKIKLRTKIGADIHARLRSDEHLRAVLQQNLTQHLQRLAGQVKDDLSTRLGDVERQVERVIDALQSQNFSIEEETRRLQEIERQLELQIQTLSAATYGRPYRADELATLPR